MSGAGSRKISSARERPPSRGAEDAAPPAKPTRLPRSYRSGRRQWMRPGGTRSSTSAAAWFRGCGGVNAGESSGGRHPAFDPPADMRKSFDGLAGLSHAATCGSFWRERVRFRPMPAGMARYWTAAESGNRRSERFSSSVGHVHGLRRDFRRAAGVLVWPDHGIERYASVGIVAVRRPRDHCAFRIRIDDGRRDAVEQGAVGRGAALADEAAVLAERGIAGAVVQAIDAPVPPVELQEPLRRGLLGAEGGYDAGDFPAGGLLFEDFPQANDAGDLANMGVVGHAVERLDDADASLLDAAAGLVEILFVAALAVSLPVDGAQSLEGLRAVGLDVHNVVGAVALDDQASRVPDRVQGIDGGRPAADVGAFQKVLQGGDFAALVAVAVGAADALAVGGEGLADPDSRRCVAGERVLERVGVDSARDSLQGRLGDRLAATGPAVSPCSQGFELLLTRGGGELRGRHAAAEAAKLSDDPDRQGRGDRALAPFGPAEVRDRFKLLAQRAHAPGLRPESRRRRREDSRVRVGHDPAGVAAQPNPYPLDLAVRLGVAAVGAGVAPRASRPGPAGRFVHNSLELRGIHEGLREQDRPPAGLLPVRAESLCRGRKEIGREAREGAALAEDQEARVVGDRVEAPKLLARPPADPAVPRPALEGAVPPACQRQPPAPPGRRAAKAALGEPPEAEIVVLLHRRVPARPLARSSEANLDLVEPESLRNSFVDDAAA